MTINKNFVVRNGLEVAQTLLYADDETNKVGINSSVPAFELDLYGDIRITGGLSVGGTTGFSGQYLESTGDALEWKTLPVLRIVETFTAVSGQVTFPSTGFLPYAAADFIDVFVDGVKLAQDEYNPSSGNNRIELIVPAIAGETIELIAYNASSIGVGGSGIQGITVGEEGVIVGDPSRITTINFVGASVTAIGSGTGVTVYFDNVISNISGEITLGGSPTWSGTSGVTVTQQSSGNYRVSFASTYTNSNDYFVLSQAMDQGFASYVGVARSTTHVDFAINKESDNAAVNTGSLAVQIKNHI